MARITAKGTLYGDRITVVCSEGENGIRVEFNGKQHELYEAKFRMHLKNPPPMGGTYYPEENSMLNAFNVLENAFFDHVTSVEAEGDIGEVPHESGLIY